MSKKEHYKHKRLLVISLSILLLLMIYFFKESTTLLRALSTIAFITFFYIIDHLFDVKFRKIHYLFIILIGISSLMLSPIYFLHPQYEKAQHLIQPILVSSIVFHLINKLNLEKKWKLIFTFFAVISILSLFEIGEYALDIFFDFKLQGVFLRDVYGLEKFNIVLEPLDDTMIDLMFGILGSCFYCLFVSIYWKVEKNS